MAQGSLANFTDTAKILSKNPLGIIALFIVLVYGLASLVLITGSSLTPFEKLPVIYFLVVFPVLVLGAFTYLVAFRSGQLFAPGDFKEEETYLELQRMRFAAVTSLAIAGQTKDMDRSNLKSLEIEDVVRSVDSAVTLAKRGAKNRKVLWVDDRPENNVLERKAMEAVGIEFTLSETTKHALSILSNLSFGAIISDMGRREGPKEGYVLLDTLRKQGNQTPLFIFASSNSQEHQAETLRHNGQGCTNDGRELFDMVTKAIFS